MNVVSPAELSDQSWSAHFSGGNVRNHPAVGPLLLFSSSGLLVASVMMVYSRGRDPDVEWLLVVFMPISGLVWAAGMFSWFYFGVLRPAMAAPPPPGFIDREPNWRQFGLIGDGRPHSTTIRRAVVAVAALTAVVGAVVAAAGWALTRDVTLVTLGVMLATGAALAVAYVRYRRVPRPPFSIWLGRSAGSDGPR